MQKNAEYGHQTFVPPNNPIGNALTQWAQGVKSRSSVAGMANALNDNLQQMATPEGALNLVAHTAWHGSPHLFDAFKNEAIGTGEGAQAYGHGLYLAEHPDVAKEYQRKLVDGQLHTPDGKVFDDLASLKNPNVKAVLNKTNGDIDAAIARGNAVIKSIPETQGAEYATHDIQVLQKLKDAGGLQRPQGALYKTDIPDAHIDKMLDWDKPLSEQSQHVQDAISAEMKRIGGSAHNGETAYKNLMFDARMNGIKSNSGAMSSNVEADAASKRLAEIGIPGIKYLDGSSRAGGEGTRNFVMFNPDDIRILERNGQATGQQPFADDLLSQFKAQQANK
jgi:hypothetical protein